MAAGYAVGRFNAAASAGRMRTLIGRACVLALFLPVTPGTSWPRVFPVHWRNA